ncbi:MAG TPA: molybdate ABC transporter substrate-binding protein [Polyangiaceae bacterium]
MRAISWLLAGFAFLSFSASARAAETQVAVAANFAGPMQVLAEKFAKKTGHHAVIVSGATGKLSAQIQNGAPFEVFLSADMTTPQKLEEQGLAVRGSRFTYARGRLVLYGPRPDLGQNGEATLKAGEFAHLAIANPKLAPYGAAALSVLVKLGLKAALEPKLVIGENISQTMQFVESGNAELGFVALSQVQVPGKPQSGSFWLVPSSLYDPIRQDAALLLHGEHNQAARALLDYLKTDEAKAVIVSYGYELEQKPKTNAPSAKH